MRVVFRNFLNVLAKVVLMVAISAQQHDDDYPDDLYRHEPNYGSSGAYNYNDNNNYDGGEGMPHGANNLYADYAAKKDGYVSDKEGQATGTHTLTLSPSFTVFHNLVPPAAALAWANSY
jgi:hypothetical protein